MPTDIEDTRNIIESLKDQYPDKEVMIVETGYIWTTGWNDNANNLFNTTHPDYAPASPEHQRDWLIDLTTAVMQVGGIGVVYWEPAWVSSPCYTEWGQGSHYENAAFFDFDNNLLLPGGVEWMEHDYGTFPPEKQLPWMVGSDPLGQPCSHHNAETTGATFENRYHYSVCSPFGQILMSGTFSGGIYLSDGRASRHFYLVYAEARGYGSGAIKITYVK
ncbi:MAG: glycosyl hydrolase 53 family protein [Lewinellaceae bacterium]|nr:glycosyl hydrolase 53 family protein [Lewinellaceae bacterium]